MEEVKRNGKRSTDLYPSFSSEFVAEWARENLKKAQTHLYIENHDLIRLHIANIHSSSFLFHLF